jgi:hypothetical protein
MDEGVYTLNLRPGLAATVFDEAITNPGPPA